MTHTFGVRVTKIRETMLGGVLITAEGLDSQSSLTFTSLNYQPRIGQTLIVSVTEDE